ncbi:MAG: undecaprenyldiphospho-muramoylpentapeptide beta-N-acetylglucosaminyltransferase [Acidobacteriota bacterium]|nr:undecaprenyldiphospho-muramoylpentapeptide beta-N-acetylglucosaminyltransferase [Acidobacteriota bacterium]MDP2389556.1 undecaprenyldiphospho-muramoylpentapeptide beta-N-acetylglucosaminyltransferase [Acidobacteriota bacterium]
MRILIAGGGTGGHLYPGIALARELQRRDPSVQVSFVGTAQGIESRVVPREGFDLDLIRVAGLKGKGRGERLQGFLLLPTAAADAWGVLSRRRPDVVIGVGGFASGPVLALAAVRGYPTMLLEQNAVPGLTNRLLARLVRAAAVNFDDSLSYFPRTGFVAGNPVRPEFFPAQNEEANDLTNKPHAAARVLIFGGSQGAHAINVAMVEAASRLAATGLELAITHQTGERDLDLVRTAYGRAGLAARVEAFIDQIDGAMKAADLVICRAGATTLAELTASGRPAVLVPLPTATDDHQRKNAEVLGRAGAAVVLDERELDGPRLAAAIAGLISDPTKRQRMSAAARRLARPDAAARIADRVEQLGQGKK